MDRIDADRMQLTAMIEITSSVAVVLSRNMPTISEDTLTIKSRTN